MSWWPWLLASAGATLVLYALLLATLAYAGRREAARAIAGLIPDCIVLFRRLVADPRVPRRTKLLVAALIGYRALPIDLVPDFVPLVGALDDVVVAAVVLRSILRATGPELLREHWPGPPSSLSVLQQLA